VTISVARTGYVGNALGQALFAVLEKNYKPMRE
jgi:hypothetical protein